VKIAFYCPNKPLSDTHPSGDQTIARGIVHSLNAFGHECVEIVRFRSRWFWKRPGGWLEALAALGQSCLRGVSFRPDLWLTYHSYYKSPDVLGPWASRALGIPYVLFQPIYGTRRRKAAGTRTGFYLNRLALKACRHAFTNNIDDIDALRRVLPPKGFTYLAPGIFPEQFHRDMAAREVIRTRYGLSDRAPVLMTAARFRADVKFESLAYLFKALARICNRYPDLKLLTVGDGPMERDLKRLAESLLPGRVIFCGRVPRHEMLRYYSSADIFVFPGIGESLGMVFLEAQACGLPVVALDTAGVPQVVRGGETGILVPIDDGRAFADAVQRLLLDEGLRQSLASRGPGYVQEHRNLWRNYLVLSRALESMRAHGGR
jgi:glycosyltransferase involved in cell wall biosynthesis